MILAHRVLADRGSEAAGLGRAVLALDLGPASVGVMEDDALGEVTRREPALERREGRLQAVEGARDVIEHGDLEVERHEEVLGEPERVALDARAERLDRVLTVGPAVHIGAADRLEDPLVLGPVLVGVDVPAVDDPARLLELGRVAAFLDPHDMTRAHRDPNVGAVDLLGGVAFAGEHPLATLARQVDHLEVVVAIEMVGSSP